MRQMKFLIFFLLSICLSISAIAQVNLQTGAAQFSLPIFSYSNNDRLSTSVALYYVDGNGLKVNEASSAVGTGWAL